MFSILSSLFSHQDSYWQENTQTITRTRTRTYTGRKRETHWQDRQKIKPIPTPSTTPTQHFALYLKHTFEMNLGDVEHLTYWGH
jgi:hypothetical protein